MNNYPQYYVPITPYYISCWKIINNKGETTIYYRDNTKSSRHYFWELEKWDELIDRKLVKQVPIEEIALIIG